MEMPPAASTEALGLKSLPDVPCCPAYAKQLRDGSGLRAAMLLTEQAFTVLNCVVCCFPVFVCDVCGSRVRIHCGCA